MGLGEKSGTHQRETKRGGRTPPCPGGFCRVVYDLHVRLKSLDPVAWSDVNAQCGLREGNSSEMVFGSVFGPWGVMGEMYISEGDCSGQRVQGVQDSFPGGGG